jgi:hypothetical protein
MSNPKPARVVFIDVFIDQIEPKLLFRVEPSPKNNPQLPNPDGIIQFNNDRHNGFDIYFELQGNTFGYYFPNNKLDALWSQTGTQCPDKVAVHDVLTPIKVFDPPYPTPPSQRTLLRAHNPNPSSSNGKGQGRFQYNLRVINAKGDWKNLDPGGDNMNGPIQFESAWSYAAVGVGSAFATAAVFAIAVSLAGFDLICPARF